MICKCSHKFKNYKRFPCICSQNHPTKWFWMMPIFFFFIIGANNSGKVIIKYRKSFHLIVWIMMPQPSVAQGSITVTLVNHGCLWINAWERGWIALFFFLWVAYPTLWCCLLAQKSSILGFSDGSCHIIEKSWLMSENCPLMMLNQWRKPRIVILTEMLSFLI